ncbi:MAG TPA: hypothetical protein VJ810_13100 [Blastocatellia bacterium]|nr:hypothetical protein [Blastocatellia bacterium]
MQAANSNQEEWIDYKVAAKLMHRPPAYFRVRNADGSYKYWPEIERWQPGGRRTRLFVRREHVETWIERSRTPAPCPVNTEMTGIGYEGALPGLLKLGAYKTIKALGLAKK